MTRNTLTFAFVLTLSIVLLAACANGDAGSGDAGSGDTGSGDTPTAGGSPSGETAPDASALEGGTEVNLPGASFTLPGAWHEETPSSSMRAAQALMPGDAGAGQLTVFFFGAGGGGGVESNIQRWIGQVEIDAANPPVREAFSGDGTQISWVEARGTIRPSTMGTGPKEPQPGSMLLGAVVEGPGGPWFFKATGPEATMDSHKGAFLAMLQSVRPSGG